MFLLCSNLIKTSQASGNCFEKDEFLQQTCLRSNWRNGNFRIANTISLEEWLFSSNLDLACHYSDLVMFHNTIGSWRRLCWYQTDSEKFSSSAVSLPPGSWHFREMAMASKTTAIFKLYHQERHHVWAVKISTKGSKPVWKRQLVGYHEMEVVRNKVCLFKRGFNPSVEILDSTNGDRICIIDFTSWDPSFVIYRPIVNRQREIEQEQTMVPVMVLPKSYFFLSLKDLACSDLHRSEQFIDSQWVGPEDFLVCDTANSYKIFNWKEEPVAREKWDSSGTQRYNNASISPNKNFMVTEHSIRETVRSFQQPATKTNISLKHERFKTQTSDLHHDTLVAYSVLDKTLNFISFAAEGRIKKAKKPLEPPKEGFELKNIWCLSTAVVAKFTKNSTVIFTAYDFKP